MGHFRLCGFLIALAIGLVACGSEGSSALVPAAATVNGERITQGEVQSEVDTFEETSEFKQLAQQQDPESVRRQFEQATLSRLVRRAVLVPLAEEQNVDVSQGEIDDQIEQIKSSLPSEEEYQKALEDRGLTQADVEQLVGDQLLEQKLRTKVTADEVPSDEELRAEFDANPEQFSQTRSQHILVEKEEQAMELSSRLQAAPEKEVGDLFTKLAKQFSTDPSAKKNGGDLGFLPAGQLVPEFEAAAAKLTIGEVSTPVSSQFGFHVIRVIDRKEPSFEEVKPQLEQQLAAGGQEQAWQDFLTEAYAEADINITSKYGELDPATQMIVNADAGDTPGAEEPEQ